MRSSTPSSAKRPSGGWPDHTCSTRDRASFPLMPIRALLVDDDHKLAELLAAYLRPHDVVVAHAPDGARALAALESGGVDIVVLDVMMPGLDGLDVLRRLRTR